MFEKIVIGGVTIPEFDILPDTEASARGLFVVELAEDYTREELISSLKKLVGRDSATTILQKYEVVVFTAADDVYITFRSPELDGDGYEVHSDDISSPEALKVLGFAVEMSQTLFAA